jgi:hypothetical protein
MKLINNRLPIFDRLCPQGGIPSGKTREDILSEVRKEAYAMRFLQGDKQNVDEDDDAEEEQSSNVTTVGEAWKLWYPQEWVGWVMYGVSSEHPTEHWVNQPMSDGPTEVEHYFTDNKGNKSSRRPPGRTNQREKVTMESVVSKQNSDTNTLRAQHFTVLYCTVLYCTVIGPEL